MATRPVANNVLGFSVALALSELEKLERFLTVLSDSPAVYGEWKRLVVRHSVLGSKVHDAKLVATMNVRGIRSSRLKRASTGQLKKSSGRPISQQDLL